MMFWGLVVGIVSFLLIGAFHVVVIRGEYRYGKGIWPIFAVLGAASLVASVFVDDVAVSAIVAVFGMTCLWTIKELYDQEERVRKGWFPENPDRGSKRDRGRYIPPSSLY